MGENIDQNNSEYGHFSRSANVKIFSLFSGELESFGNSGNQPRRTAIYLKFALRGSSKQYKEGRSLHLLQGILLKIK